MADDCIFCRISEGDLPAFRIYEDENTLAFLDAEPVSKGHTLVIPKEHTEDIHGALEMDYMWETVVKVADALKEAFEPGGLNITQNSGEEAGQEVFHLHFHITPRYGGDEIDISYNRENLERGEEISRKVRRAIR